MPIPIPLHERNNEAAVDPTDDESAPLVGKTRLQREIVKQGGDFDRVPPAEALVPPQPMEEVNLRMEQTPSSQNKR